MSSIQQGLASLPSCEDKGLCDIADAIRANDPQRLAKLLETIDPNRPYGSKHPTMLHFALFLDSAKSGSAVSYEIYHLLVKAGCDANLIDRSGLNCLLYALHYPIIRHDPYALNKLNLLVTATKNLNYVPERLAEPSALMAAIRVPSTLPIAEILLTHYRVDPNTPSIYPGGRRLYPLSSAMLNHVPPKLFDCLLASGADPNLIQPNDQHHPLFLCMELPRLPVDYLTSLLQYGADVGVVNGRGQNLIQVLLQKQQGEPQNIRKKLRLLLTNSRVDVRRPCYVGSVSAESISVLHYILHDGITSQFTSETTKPIGDILIDQFQNNNYELAKLKWTRSKSIRSRTQRDYSALQQSTATTPTLLNAASTHKAFGSNTDCDEDDGDDDDDLPCTSFTLPSGSKSPSASHFVSPRPSEFSLRFVDNNFMTPLLRTHRDVLFEGNEESKEHCDTSITQGSGGSVITSLPFAQHPTSPMMDAMHDDDSFSLITPIQQQQQQQRQQPPATQPLLFAQAPIHHDMIGNSNNNNTSKITQSKQQQQQQQSLMGDDDTLAFVSSPPQNFSLSSFLGNQTIMNDNQQEKKSCPRVPSDDDILNDNNNNNTMGEEQNPPSPQQKRKDNNSHDYDDDEFGTNNSSNNIKPLLSRDVSSGSSNGSSGLRLSSSAASLRISASLLVRQTTTHTNKGYSSMNLDSLGLDGETLRRLEEERSFQDHTDAQDILRVIECCIDNILWEDEQEYEQQMHA